MANSARNLTLAIVDSLSPSQYNVIGTLVDVTFSLTREPDDITSKGDAGAQTLYTAGTIKAYNISGTFITDSGEGFTDLRTAAFSSDPKVTAQLDDDVKKYSGVWAIVSFSEQGGNAGAIRATIELRSAGAITETSS